MYHSIGWTVFSALAIVASIAVVTRRNPIYGALWLMVFFFSLSGVFVFLRASFLAAVQLFVYVGAVIVLYLFVIMMLDFEKLKKVKSPPLLTPVKGACASLLLFVFLALPLRFAIKELQVKEIAHGFGSTPWMAHELYLKYPFPIELASILLIIALVGAFALTARYLPKESPKEEKKEEKKEEVKV